VAARITVYEKPTCTACRSLFALLSERGVDFERVNYVVDGLPEEKMRELLAKSGMRARDAIRTREPEAADIGSGESDDEIIARMVRNPVLLQRPWVEAGDRAVLARPVEKALEIL
jgi:arsenate reductase (glutaredoxin)